MKGFNSNKKKPFLLYAVFKWIAIYIAYPLYFSCTPKFFDGGCCVIEEPAVVRGSLGSIILTPSQMMTSMNEAQDYIKRKNILGYFIELNYI